MAPIASGVFAGFDMTTEPILQRDPVTGDFPAAYATKNFVEERGFYNSWHDEYYVNMAVNNPDLLDTSGLSNGYTFGETFSSVVYPFKFERHYAGDDFTRSYSIVARRYWYMAWVFAALYVIGVHWAGPKWMASRGNKPVECKTALKYWNLFLAVFSFCGVVRVVPSLFLLPYRLGWDGLLCHPGYAAYGGGPTGLWVTLFICSKVFEFADTWFLIARNRPVGLLHWWHHMSVLLYCWDALMWETPCGIVFCGMNYTVHSIMYFYYYLMAAQPPMPKMLEGESKEEFNKRTANMPKPKKLTWGHWVTKMQILQMIVGMFTVISYLYFRSIYPNCDGNPQSLHFSFLIYFSYFVLFSKFYFERYFNIKFNGDWARALLGLPAAVKAATKPVEEKKVQ